MPSAPMGPRPREHRPRSHGVPLCPETRIVRLITIMRTFPLTCPNRTKTIATWGKRPAGDCNGRLTLHSVTPGVAFPLLVSPAVTRFAETTICPACKGPKTLSHWLCETCDPSDLAIPADWPVDPMNVDGSQKFNPCHHCRTPYSESVVECPRCGETGHLDPSFCESCISRAEARNAATTYCDSCNAVTLARASLEPHPLLCDACHSRISNPRHAAIVCQPCQKALYRR